MSEELRSALLEILAKEIPVSIYSDRAYATPYEAYCSFLELAKRTLTPDQVQVLLKAREKETLEDALSVDFVMNMAMAELKDRLHCS